MAAPDPKHVLRRTFGFPDFRPHQREIVTAILSGRDVFAALPTGGGKSLCYQLPGIMNADLAVVVSPLIALMEDQVSAAREQGIAAAALNSALDSEEAHRIWSEMRDGRLDLLYVSPERLGIESFRDVLAEVGVGLIAVDEAHCISEWGHEFRPDYRALRHLRAWFPAATIAAFTATATQRVQDDVIELLGLDDPLVVRASFDRPEIFYRVRRKTSVEKQIVAFARAHRRQAGIVYRATRKAVEQTAVALEAAGVRARPYHAGLSSGTRSENQRAFVHDEIDVIVATIAFGMGIDKANVRWVVHGDLPRSLEAWYQETGRAARDGDPADTCLFYGPGDVATIRYHIDQMEVPAERARAEAQLAEVLRFVDGERCRRVRLLDHFDEAYEPPCGACDVCAGEIAFSDRTEAARMLMSAAVRTGEFFGADHIVDILVGEASDRVVDRGHHNLPTFGVGRDEPRTFWRALARSLEAEGHLERRDGPRSGLRLSASGRAILRGAEPFMARTELADDGPGRSGARATRTGRAGSGDLPTEQRGRRVAGDSWRDGAAGDDDEALFQRLRELRLQLARERRVPPYTVFHDRTLRAIVVARPSTLDELLAVPGVGEKKARTYGEAVLFLIRDAL